MNKAIRSIIKRAKPIQTVVAIALVVAGVAAYSQAAAMIAGGVLLLIDNYRPVRSDNGRPK